MNNGIPAPVPPAMPGMPGGLPPSTFIPNPAYVAEQAAEKKIVRSDKLEATAIEVLKAAVAATSTQSLSAQQLADYAELLWRWTTTDNWPLPGDKA